MDIYVSDEKRYKGLWVGEGGGFVVTPRPGQSINAERFDISVTAASRRLTSDTQGLGGRFFFKCPDFLSLKRVDPKVMDLLLATKDAQYSSLVLQRKVGQCFTIGSTSDLQRDLEVLTFSPVVVQLLSPGITAENKDCFWHKNLAFRVLADKRFCVTRPDFKQEKSVA